MKSNKIKNQKSLQPKLRFPEFHNKQDWEEVYLADVLTEHKLKNDGKSRVHSVSVHKGIIDQIEHLGRSFSASNTSKYNLVKPFDIIYTKSPTGDFPFGIVKQSRIDHNVIVSPLYGVFSPTNKYLGYILDSYFESPIRAKNYLDPITQKGAKNTIQISNDTFLSRTLYLPNNEVEQQKIAGCLLSLDKLIELENRKLEALQSYKKGLMQEIFPAEGQALPKLRLPEFQSTPEWEQKSGDKLFDPISNKKHNSDLPILAITQEYGAIPRDKIDYRVSVTDKSIEGYKVVEVGDFIISLRSFQGGIEYSKYKGLCSPAYIILRGKTDDYANFFKHYFKTSRFIKDLNKDIEGIRDGKMVSYDQFSKILIPLPQSKKEQQKISDFLSSVEDIITTQTQKLESLRLHKKGLMQQLFPII